MLAVGSSPSMRGSPRRTVPKSCFFRRHRCRRRRRCCCCRCCTRTCGLIVCTVRPRNRRPCIHQFVRPYIQQRPSVCPFNRPNQNVLPPSLAAVPTTQSPFCMTCVAYRWLAMLLTLPISRFLQHRMEAVNLCAHCTQKQSSETKKAVLLLLLLLRLMCKNSTG